MLHNVENEVSPMLMPISKSQCYTMVKGKGKVVPVLLLTEHHAMNAYWGSGSIAPRIL